MSTDNGSNKNNAKQYCILFYKYHPLTDNPDILETYRHATETLCTSLQLTGRILIGLSSDGEGINGTLAGTKDDLDAYVDCMLGKDFAHNANLDQRRKNAVLNFREASKQFFDKLNLPELFLNSPNDFKWSSWSNNSFSSDNSSSGIKAGEDWFPDLNIKIVNEIISTGGAFADISTKDTSVGYLTPQEWHKEIQSLMKKHKKKQNSSNSNNDEGDSDVANEDVDTILIDVRNHKECSIGAFAPGISINPQTKTFAQFPKWVKKNSAESEDPPSKEDASAKSQLPSPSLLNNKRILMYCTGGIRCEKASAYIRQVVPQNKGIYHLKGGIHKYLEEFGQDASAFVGKNFVFDRRGALDAKGHGIDEKAARVKDSSSSQVESSNHSTAVIGKCQYCSSPYDTFHPENVCTVCREPILICEKCQLHLYQKQQGARGLTTSSDKSHDGATEKKSICRAEYHCQDHVHLNNCYFTSLHGFSASELENQLEQLQLHSRELEGMGKKGKQRRRTLRKQIDRIEACMKQKLSNDKCEGATSETPLQCRHCGSSTCTSDCWGFHGGNTRMVNKKKQGDDGGDGPNDNSEVKLKTHKQRNRVPSNQRPAKRLKRQNDVSEIEVLQLSNPPSKHRNDTTGLRVPPPVIRVLRSGVKGRWCGKTVQWVLQNDFGESLNSLNQKEKDERLEQLVAVGLIRINGFAVKSSDVVLRNMDAIERIVHWHEPPINVPSKISLTKHTLRESILSFNDEATDSPLLYCINKPSSIPIYPAGPYYANSLLMMVEAQEGLPPKTLIPLHRIDRATSGVLLCANMSSVARLIQGRMTCKDDEEDNPPVRKLYLARVKGKFPAASSETPTIPEECASIASIAWCGDENNVAEVNAPISVQLESKENTSSGNNEGESTPNVMMHRTVREDGKHSISRFKLISYNATTNQSLVSCAPVTGRGHQLRVHLQLIGFPIHNDVEYGGEVNAKTIEAQERLSAQSMLDVTVATSESRHEESVTNHEVKSAVELCRCCSSGLGGINSSFNSAQLLGCGHAIDLHAYKYCISFKQRGPIGSEKHEDGTTMEFSTDLPSWASSFVGLKSVRLTWLK